MKNKLNESGQERGAKGGIVLKTAIVLIGANCILVGCIPAQPTVVNEPGTTTVIRDKTPTQPNVTVVNRPASPATHTETNTNTTTPPTTGDTSGGVPTTTSSSTTTTGGY